MTQDMELPVRFAARRSMRNTLIFYVGFGGFGVFGLVLLVLGARVGLPLIAFSAAFLALLVLANLKPGWAYFVVDSGITVQRTFKSRHIPREAIAELREITDQEAVAVVYPDQIDQASSTRHMEIREAFRAQRRVGETIGFATVPIILSETRKGGPVSVFTAGAKTSGDFVLIVTKEGKNYLLSPQDPAGLIQAFQLTV